MLTENFRLEIMKFHFYTDQSGSNFNQRLFPYYRRVYRMHSRFDNKTL